MSAIVPEYCVIVRRDSEARDTKTFVSLPKAKQWGAEQIRIGWTINNASLFSNDAAFRTLHASRGKNGAIRWVASKF
jgi:hypothetical protein